MFTIPYRWTWGTLGKNLFWIWYSLKRGFRNVVRWVPVIWSDEDFDWDALAWIMETKLRWMVKSSCHWCWLHSDEAREQMQVCVDLLRRLREDSSDDLPRDKYGYIRHVTRMREWQQELGRILGKHLRSWWD